MKFLMMMLVLGLGSEAMAKGGQGGNGGGVWVCQNKDSLGTIRNIELVDFYEAEKEFKLTRKKYTGLDVDEILDLYKSRILEIDKKLSTNLEPYFLKLQEKLNPVDSDLEIIDDALYRLKPAQKWCEGGKISYQQMANYTDYGSILINENLFNQPQFDAMEKAGLYLHEIIYEYLRENSKDQDSQRARRIVGVVASTLTTEQARQVLESVRIGGECGLLGTVEERIKDCSTVENSVKGNFILVSRSKELKEVYKHTKTGLIWSDRVENNMSSSDAYVICQKDLKEMSGIKIGWRLPSIEEYLTAEEDGIRNFLPNMYVSYWTSSLQPLSKYKVSGGEVIEYSFGIEFDGVTGTVEKSRSSFGGYVRCVARIY